MEDPKRSPFMNKKLVSEIYLPRMLSTKVMIVSCLHDVNIKVIPLCLLNKCAHIAVCRIPINNVMIIIIMLAIIISTSVGIVHM